MAAPRKTNSPRSLLRPRSVLRVCKGWYWPERIQMEVTRSSRFSHLKATNGNQPAGHGRPAFVYIHVSCKGWGLSVHTDKAEPCRCLGPRGTAAGGCLKMLALTIGEWFVWALAGARRLWRLRMVHVLAAEYGPPKETCGKTSDERSRTPKQ